MKAKYFIYVCVVLLALSVSSCSDLLEQESSHVSFTDDKQFNEAGDSIYGLTGVMQKVQALGDRTVLLGELRGDLVNVTEAADADLREIATFTVSDDNKYNSPKDYYAVINNSNFYLAKVDTTVKDNRGKSFFIREYAAVKAYRAWTYLQLAINYGKVPFITEPILTKDAADAQYPVKDIKEICDYFINDLKPLANVDRPGLGNIGTVDSRLLFIPIHLLLGDLNLWAEHYDEAALSYYRYITTANGSNSYYPVKAQRVQWANSNWTMPVEYGNYARSFSSESWNDDRDLIMMIPGDSLPSQGNYSELRNIYNSTAANAYKASVVPSQSLQSLSAKQSNNIISSDRGHDIIYAPTGLDNNRSGDLRLQAVWSHYSYGSSGNVTQMQTISKFSTRNVHIYRRTMVYLRLAEALNRAGYPHFAYQILARGVNNDVIEQYVLPYCTTDEQKAFVRQFDFPSTSNSGYRVFDINDMDASYNTIGIHSRGSGWACYNQNYQMPDDASLSGEDLKQWQMEKVEDMIVDENALECAFEGTRYYDLLRVAIRRGNPSYVADKVNARNAENGSGVETDLTQMQNLFLHWNGKIGY